MTKYYTKKVGFSSQTIFEQQLREQAGLFQEYKQQEKEKEEIPGTSLPEAVELK